MKTNLIILLNDRCRDEIVTCLGKLLVFISAGTTTTLIIYNIMFGQAYAEKISFINIKCTRAKGADITRTLGKGEIIIKIQYARRRGTPNESSSEH